MNHPHDLFFKEAFSRKSVACSFICNYFNDKIKAAIDFDTLSSVKDSHITTDLIEFFSDTVYSALSTDHKNCIYILFEHKSYDDHGTGSQLIENIAMLLQYHRRQCGRSAKIPKIFTVVINQTASAWDFANSYALHFKPFVSQPIFPELDFTVLDLSGIPDQKITGIPYLRILFLTLKHIHHPQLPKKLGEIAVIFRELGNEPELNGYFKAFLLYIKATAPAEFVSDIMQKIKGVAMELDEENKRMLDEALREFFKEELIEARREIEQQTRREFEQQLRREIKKEKNGIALNMISQGMDDQTIIKATGLSSEEIQILRKSQ